MTSPTQVLKSVGPKLVLFFKSVAVYFVLLPEGSSVWAAAVKCAPVLSLIFFVLLHGMGRKDEYAYSRRIVVGLCWSCVGDALLVWPQHFLAGMAAFGVAQCAYIAAFGFRPLRPWLGAVIYAFALYVSGVLSSRAPGVMVAALPVYSALLATMVWRATARVRGRRSWPELGSAAGAVCFLVSDGLIGCDGFYAPVPHAHVLIMSTYYLAQLGIALSIVDSISEYRLSQEKKLLQCQKDGAAPIQVSPTAAATGDSNVRRKNMLNTTA